MTWPRALAMLTAVLVFPSIARAQDDEAGRLREALRRVTIDLRAAQDAQTTLQASLDEANRQKAAMAAALEAANAKAAAVPPVAAAQPAQDAQVAALKSALASARARDGELQAGLAKWQGAYNQAAGIARQKDAESRSLAAGGAARSTQIALCSRENAALQTVSEDILHLYKTAGFRRILIGSYEPLLGLYQVKLENIVQDYDDKIRAQSYVPLASGPDLASGDRQ